MISSKGRVLRRSKRDLMNEALRLTQNQRTVFFSSFHTGVWWVGSISEWKERTFLESGCRHLDLDSTPHSPHPSRLRPHQRVPATNPRKWSSLDLLRWFTAICAAQLAVVLHAGGEQPTGSPTFHQLSPRPRPYTIAAMPISTAQASKPPNARMSLFHSPASRPRLPPRRKPAARPSRTLARAPNTAQNKRVESQYDGIDARIAPAAGSRHWAGWGR